MFYTKVSIEENIHEQIRNQKIFYACHYLSKLNLLLFYNFLFKFLLSETQKAPGFELLIAYADLIFAYE